jgi:hypothetical protein
MNVLRNGFIATLMALPFFVFGGGACTVATPDVIGGPGDPMDVAVGGGCTSDDQCDVGDFCDQGSGLCATEGSIAIGTAGCNDDRDCSGGCCDPTDGTCVDCGAAGSVALDGTCVDDTECATGDYCDSSGVCTADPYASSEGSEAFGAQCFEDADCDTANGDYCDIETDTCVN